MRLLTGERRARRRVCVVVAMATVAAALIAPTAADADTFRWRNDANGDWNVAGNWIHIGANPGDRIPNEPGDVEKRTIAPQSRMTVHVDQIAGLEAASASVQVVSDNRAPRRGRLFLRVFLMKIAAIAAVLATGSSVPIRSFFYHGGDDNDLVLIETSECAITGDLLVFGVLDVA